MVSAMIGLHKILLGGDVDVRKAILRRAPESLAAMSAFIAFTPDLSTDDGGKKRDGWTYEGSLKDAMSFDPDDLRVRLCQFTSKHRSGRGPPFKCNETYLPLSPPQNGPCYCHVMTTTLVLLSTLSDPRNEGAAQAVRQMQSSPAFVPCVVRLMELLARWDEEVDQRPRMRNPSDPNLVWKQFKSLPQKALQVLAWMCRSPYGPRARWLLRSHSAHERRWDPATMQWTRLATDRAAGAPPDGMMSVLLRIRTEPTGDISDKYAAVLTAVTQGQLSDVKDDGQLMLPPLPPLTDDPSEVKEAFAALGLAEDGALTDEIGACLSEEERVRAMAFFIDARCLTPGRRVVLHGLASKPELNDRTAVISGPKAADKLRYPVRMEADGDGAASMLMRPRNMAMCESQEDAPAPRGGESEDGPLSAKDALEKVLGALREVRDTVRDTEAAPTTGKNAAKNKKKREKAKLKKATNEGAASNEGTSAEAADEPPPLISDVSKYEAQLGTSEAPRTASRLEPTSGETMDETERDLINKILGFTV